tara:strand:- start:33 stop:1574 length:1542 start_codon:yes stop_codon:yes gene_type:complete
MDVEFIKKEFKKIQNFFAAGEYEKVIEKTKVLLKKDNSQVPFYNLIGLSYRQLGKNDLAEDIFKKGLKKFPNNISILSNIGALYRVLGRYEEAEENLTRALKQNEKSFIALCNLANVKRERNQNDDAIELYEKAYKINNNNETILKNLAGAYQIGNKFEQSKKLLLEMNNKFPNNASADHMYSSIHTYKTDDPHREQMIQKLSNSNITKEGLAFLNFAIAKSYSDIKNHSESAKYFVKANDTYFNLMTHYKFSNEKKIFEIIKEKFKDFEYKNLDTDKEPNLIFIVGLPRSGTTLTHQIVSSHTKVYGAGELTILNDLFNKQIFDKDFIEIFNKNSDQNPNFKKLSEEIFNKFKQFNNKIILDKAPLNFRWIGFIKMLFPTAKIIHCKRNLKDTALSIYKNVFDGGSLPWSYNQETLVEFIKMYNDLMSFWHEKLPNQIYDCEYENLVNDQINETKKLINFCNLSWEENCIDYTKNDTGIKTVSISQARKPIYKSSVKLSDKYTDYLEFLKKI